MHIIQKKLFELSKSKDLDNLTLREIGRLINESHPQKIKHHLNQLQKKGLLKHNLTNNSSLSPAGENNFFLSIPILGTANCGPATFYADENLEGYLKVSSGCVSKSNSVCAIKASGNSMNKSNIKGKNIEEGDYVIIDTIQKMPQDNDYVLSIIDGSANIKKFMFDKKNNMIVLISESTYDFPPIFIHPDDADTFQINGKVIEVIKKPDFN